MPGKPLTLSQAVDLFRATEQVETVLILVHRDRAGDILRQLFLAWPRAAPTPANPRRAEPRFDDGPALWDNLWAAVAIDEPKLAEITGLAPAVVKRNVAILRGFRLIYPDGRVNELGLKALRQLAKTQLKL